MPPAPPRAQNRADLEPNAYLLFEDIRRLRSPSLSTAIFPAEWETLGVDSADLLITHEAPSVHPRGFREIDELAQALGAVRAFHGHHHTMRRIGVAPNGSGLVSKLTHSPSPRFATASAS
jgi:hypothetical protein